MWIIVRTNGIEYQLLEDDFRAWDYFLGHMADDVKWFPEGKPGHKPWKFESFDTAVDFVKERNKRLKNKETGWEYHFRKVET